MLNFYVLSIFPTWINEIMLGCRQMSFGWLQIRVIKRRVSSKEILCIKVIVSIPKDCMIALLSQRNNLSLFSEFINRQFAHCWGIMLRITTHTQSVIIIWLFFSLAYTHKRGARWWKNHFYMNQIRRIKRGINYKETIHKSYFHSP